MDFEKELVNFIIFKYFKILILTGLVYIILVSFAILTDNKKMQNFLKKF